MPILILGLVLILTSSVSVKNASATHTVAASPPGGTYDSTQMVDLSSTNSSATIHFTIDGSEPNVNSTVFNGTAIAISTNTTLKFIANISIDNHTTSAVTEFYTVLSSPPTVIETEPEDGERRVNTGIIINATFSKPIDESTLNPDSFTVTSQYLEDPVSGTTTYNSTTNTASFAPDSPLELGVIYTATLTEDIKDNGGNSLNRFSWTFTSGGRIEIQILDLESFSGLSGSAFTVTPDPFQQEESRLIEDNGPLDSDFVVFGSPIDGDIIIDNVENNFTTYVVSQTIVPTDYSRIYGDVIVTVTQINHCDFCGGSSFVMIQDLSTSSSINDIENTIELPRPYLNISQFEMYENNVIIGRFSGVQGDILPTFGPIVSPNSDQLPPSLFVTPDNLDLVFDMDSYNFLLTAEPTQEGANIINSFDIPTYPAPDSSIANSVVYVVPAFVIPYEGTKNNFVLTPIIDSVYPGLTLYMKQASFVESKVAKVERMNITFATEGHDVGFSFGITDTRPPGTPDPELDAAALFLDIGFVGDIDFSDPITFQEPPRIDILVNKTLEGFDILPDGCSDFVMLLFDEEEDEWVEIEKLRAPTLDTGADTPSDFTDDKCGFTLEPPHFSKFAVGGVRGQAVTTESILPAARHGGGGGGSTSIEQMTSGSNVESETRVGSNSVLIMFDMVEPGSGQLKISTTNIDRFSEIFDEITTSEGEKRGIVRLDDSVFSTAGTIYDVDASAVKFQGMVKVTIPYDEQSARSLGSESNVRLLHYDEAMGKWQDVTIFIDTEKNTVTGMTDSLSPVIAGVIQDGTFPAIYFDMNPLSKIVSGDNSKLIGNLQKGSEITIPVTIKNTQRIDQQYTVIVQVLDENRVVSFIDWQSGSLARSEGIVVSKSWIPKEEGNHTVQIFVWDNLDRPVAISEVNVMKLSVGN